MLENDYHWEQNYLQNNGFHELRGHGFLLTF